MLKKQLAVMTQVAIMLFGFYSEAKDMTHRLGVGFKNNTSISIPSLAGVYYTDKNTAFTGSFGLDTEKNNSKMQISAGLRSIVFHENNMNCYVSGQVGIINDENPVTGKSNGVELLGLGGVEFFFSGLENLGFTVEAGLALATIRNSRLRTVADDPLRAGIVFYF